jgi:azurin
MKQLIPTLFVFALFGCSKSNQEPVFQPNRAYAMKYQTDPQIVKTRTNGDTLHLDFHENVNLLVDPSDYSGSWALILEENFTKSYLDTLEYNAQATASLYAHNWVPSNTNDVAPGQKTVSNVTVDGKKYVKVTIARVFEFYNVMSSAQAAVNQQNALLQTTTDNVSYKTYYMSNGGYSLSNDATLNLTYTK